MTIAGHSEQRACETRNFPGRLAWAGVLAFALALVGPSVARAEWPAADPALLVRESVTCVVQVNGKVRDRLEVSPDITEQELHALATAAPGVTRALTGLEIKRVVVRPPKLVNIVAA